mmetsp:Transcript_38358/g.90980  ORF Transcript_38358/g.90980 Transcript_38358/m.90980 type:complete len:315 (-) Transcript_38358:1417-2361(-)
MIFPHQSCCAGLVIPSQPFLQAAPGEATPEGIETDGTARPHAAAAANGGPHMGKGGGVQIQGYPPPGLRNTAQQAAPFTFASPPAAAPHRCARAQRASATEARPSAGPPQALPMRAACASALAALRGSPSMRSAAPQVAAASPASLLSGTLDSLAAAAAADTASAAPSWASRSCAPSPSRDRSWQEAAAGPCQARRSLAASPRSCGSPPVGAPGVSARASAAADDAVQTARLSGPPRSLAVSTACRAAVAVMPPEERASSTASCTSMAESPGQGNPSAAARRQVGTLLKLTEAATFLRPTDSDGFGAGSDGTSA